MSDIVQRFLQMQLQDLKPKVRLGDYVPLTSLAEGGKVIALRRCQITLKVEKDWALPKTVKIHNQYYNLLSANHTKARYRLVK